MLEKSEDEVRRCGHTREPVRGHCAQTPWRLDEGEMASRIVREKTDVRAQVEDQEMPET